MLDDTSDTHPAIGCRSDTYPLSNIGDDEQIEKSNIQPLNAELSSIEECSREDGKIGYDKIAFE